LSEDLRALLASLGPPHALFRRLHAADGKPDEVEEDEDWDPDEEPLDEPDVVGAGLRFAGVSAAICGDAAAFPWVVWACAVAADEDEAAQTGAQTQAARHLRTWLERRAARDGAAALAGPAAKLAVHPHPRVRAALAEVLAGLGEVPAALVHDPDPSVRWAARRPGDAPGTGLLPPDAPPALREALAALDPAHLAALDPPRRHRNTWRYAAAPEAFAAALDALPDALALAVMPRLVESPFLATAVDEQVLKALFARPGGLAAFVALLPRLAAGDASEVLWDQTVVRALTPARSPALLDGLLAAIEADLPPPGAPCPGFHGGRFLSRLVEAMSPHDPAPLRAALERIGPVPDDYAARWTIRARLKHALQVSEGPP
jgi:hypothetical protein